MAATRSAYAKARRLFPFPSGLFLFGDMDESETVQKNSLEGWRMRAIIRFSVEQENNGALRNKLNKILIDADFIQAQNTATYERKGLQELGLGQILQDFWSTAHTHTGPGRLDHFWMYLDR